MDWSRILSLAFLVQVLAASIRLATPLILAALGETFAERSGVLNLSIEGIMLMGGFAGFATAMFTHNLWLGALAGIVAGGMLGLIFAFFTVTLRSDQIVTGLALLILSSGAASYFYRLMFTGISLMPHLTPFPTVAIPGLASLPIIGTTLFNHNAITYLMLLLTPLCLLVFYRTPFGLRINAVGEYPRAADSVGINVYFVRYVCVIVGGALAGLGGAYFSLADLGLYSDSMVGGRGFIALALVVFGRWNPALVLVGGLLFGMVDAVQIRLQLLGAPIPPQFLIMMPYVLTILILLIGRGRTTPAALNQAYARE